MQITRTGKKIAFLDIHIGSPFFAYGKVWVRTAFDAATVLLSSEAGLGANVCNFIIDGTTTPKRGPYSHKGETCEEVECVEIATAPIAPANHISAMSGGTFDPPAHPNLRNFLDLSTTHLSSQTKAMMEKVSGEFALNHWVAATPYGWFVYCDEENAEDSIPEDLFACMTYARKNGAEYILFDQDADTLTDLPTFDN